MSTQQEILKKYDAELQKYANGVAIPFGRYLENGRKPFQSFLKYLFDFYLFLSYLTDSGLIPNDTKHVAFRVLLAKASLSLFGVYTALQNGLITEASNSLRSIFEVYLNVKLILEKDTGIRLKLFENFELVERWNRLQENQSLLSSGVLTQDQFDKSFSKADIDKIEEDYNSVKTDYHPKQPYHWAWKIFSITSASNRNPSIRYIAQHLGLSFDYVKVYSTTSIAVHGSASLANILSTGKTITLAPQFTKLIYNNGSIALDYSSNIVQQLVAYFKFKNPDEINIYIESFILAALNEADKGLSEQRSL